LENREGKIGYVSDNFGIERYDTLIYEILPKKARFYW
jgi:hypothetical protein